MPFAEAHEIAGACVRYCETAGIELSDLTPAQLAEISPHLNAGVLDVLTVAGSIDSRDGRGGTAPARVASSWRSSSTRSTYHDLARSRAELRPTARSTG